MDIAAEVDGADALEQHHWVTAHTAIVLTLLPIFFFNTYCTELFAMTVPAIALSWQISPKVLAGAMSLGWLGSGIGSLVGGLLGDRIGRYRTVLMASGLAALASIATAFVTWPGSLSLLRAVVGVALGATVPPALALIAECTPGRTRGMVISLAMVSSPLGMSACAAVSGYMLPRYGWPTVFLVGGGLTLAFTLLFAFAAVESPRYLAQRVERGDALRRVLRRLQVPMPPEGFVLPTKLGQRSPISKVLAPPYLGATLRTGLCFMAVFVSVTAFTSWVPTALTSAGFAQTLAGSAMSAWSLAGAVGTLLAGVCLTRWGAGRSTQAFALGSALAMVLAVFVRLEPGGGSAGLIAAMALSGFMMSALITAVFAFATDAYPSEVRSTGVGMGAMVGRCSAVLGSFGGVYVIDALGLRPYFLFIGALAAMPFLLLLSGARQRSD